jgi:hypothetical protein
VRVEGEAGVKPGDSVFLTPREDRIHKFNKEGRRVD